MLSLLVLILCQDYHTSEAVHIWYENNCVTTTPTNLMSTSQLAMFHGRKIESHIVATKDGFQLTVHRIVPSPNNIDHETQNQTIILHHGLLGSSADWILLGSKQSLPYLLCDAGYDVWMLNARGNYYSRNHIYKDIKEKDFWEFSWQEMGEFDLPAVIDYVREIKKYSLYKQIDYIGHSMGATALLVLLSTSPIYNQYFRSGILLAPLAFMTNVEGPLKDATSNKSKQVKKIFKTKEFMPSRRIPYKLSAKYCRGISMFCCNPLYFLTGEITTVESWTSDFIASVLYHVPAGGSSNTILHYAQLVKTGKFHKFNDISYNYDMKKITLPIALISSNDDFIATEPDVLRLYLSLKNPVDHHVIRFKNFTHTEFVWGPQAVTLVFHKVMEYLRWTLTYDKTSSLYKLCQDGGSI